MNELNKEYLTLFNGITSAIDSIEKLGGYLKLLQKEAEELYISKADLTTAVEEKILI